MTAIQILYVFVTALFSSLTMVPLLRRWALERGEVDRPDGERKTHLRATPRIGGIAIFMAVLFALLVHADLDTGVRGILAGGLVVFFTGMVDDLHGISARKKFLGQIGGCLVAMAVGQLYITSLGNPFGAGEIHLPLWLAWPFTVFAVVGVCNAINLIDGLDGLAGGVSVIALAAFFILACQDGNQPAIVLSAAGLGAILGFLKFNFYPARIFMGDTGSLTIGFLLGFTAVQLTQPAAAGIAPVIPVLILGLPILDTLWVMTRRILRKTSPFTPDRTHLHHKFLNLGLQHRFTVILIYGLSLFWAIFSLLFLNAPEYFLLAVYLCASLAFYLVLRHVLNHPQRFPIVARDSAAGIRHSATYLKIAEGIDRGVPALMMMAGLYLLAAVWTARYAGGNLWQVNGILGVSALGVLYVTRDARNQFLLAVTYVAVLLVTFSVESAGTRELFWGLTLARFSDVLFVLMALLVAVKICFRKDGDFFISTADILFFALSVLFSTTYSQLPVSAGPEVLLKGIVFYLAVKTLVARNRRRAVFSVGSVLTVLLLIAVRGAFV